jgi:hypothetical protein
MPILPVPQEAEAEELQFKASLGSLARHCFFFALKKGEKRDLRCHSVVEC